MKIIAKLSRSKVAAEVGHDLDLLVRLRAPAPPDGAARPPVCIVPVVDVSGSMQGAKIEAVRHALRRLLDHLVPGDHIGLVAFDSDVRTLSPIVELTEARKVGLRRLVDGLAAGSSTNLAGGLLGGLRLARAAARPDLRARIVLLTDGCANAGVATTWEQLVALVCEHGGGVGISAFGYGDDCDQALLLAVADAGGGSYAYIQSDDAVLTAFARELGGLVATCATDVRLRVAPIAGAPVEEKMGDVLYQGEGRWCGPLAAPTHLRARGVEVCAVEATWRDALGREQRARVAALLDYVPAAEADTADDPEVARARDERLLRAAQEEAEAHARSGDLGRARRALKHALDELRDPALAAFVRETLLPCYEEAMYAACSGVRASTAAALHNRRIHSADATVAVCFDLGPGVAEIAMEESFRGGKKKRPPPSK